MFAVTFDQFNVSMLNINFFKKFPKLLSVSVYPMLINTDLVYYLISADKLYCGSLILELEVVLWWFYN